MAGKSWQPSHEPIHRKGTLSKQWKEGGKGWENCLDDELALLTTLQVHAQSTLRNASNEGHMEFRRMRICKKTR